MIWHKIALRTDVGKADIFRPTYSHMLCFSKDGPIGIPVADVILRGNITYANGFGIDAVKLVIEFLKKHKIKTVIEFTKQKQIVIKNCNEEANRMVIRLPYLSDTFPVINAPISIPR